jgi:hypothetical protein
LRRTSASRRDWPIEDVAGRAVLVLRRFDRDGARLIAFLSTASTLDAHRQDGVIAQSLATDV